MSQVANQIQDAFAVKLKTKQNSKIELTEILPSPTQQGTDLDPSDALETAKPTMVAFRLRHISPAGTWAKSSHVTMLMFRTSTNCGNTSQTATTFSDLLYNHREL
jgi:hypothetical protein